MSKVTLTTGTNGQTLHGRTSGDTIESQVMVLGTDGSDIVLDPATLATQATLAAVLAKLIAAPATDATLASVLASVDGLEALLAHGTFAYAAGTSTATVDVPSGGRVRQVFVIAGAAATTVTIAGGATITIPAGAAFDAPIIGDATLGGDVVIGGTPASYYVAWTT